MKLGIFSYLAWAVVNMVNHTPDNSNYIDAWLVYEAEDLYGLYRERAEFAKRSRERRENLNRIIQEVSRVKAKDLKITIRVDTSKFTDGLKMRKLPRLPIRRRVKLWKQMRGMRRLAKKYSPYIFLPCSPGLERYAAAGRKEQIRQIHERACKGQ